MGFCLFWFDIIIIILFVFHFHTFFFSKSHAMRHEWEKSPFVGEICHHEENDGLRKTTSWPLTLLLKLLRILASTMVGSSREKRFVSSCGAGTWKFVSVSSSHSFRLNSLLIGSTWPSVENRYFIGCLFKWLSVSNSWKQKKYQRTWTKTLFQCDCYAAKTIVPERSSIFNRFLSLQMHAKFRQIKIKIYGNNANHQISFPKVACCSIPILQWKSARKAGKQLTRYKYLQVSLKKKLSMRSSWSSFVTSWIVA